MPENIRCAGCGKVIDLGDKITDVKTGSMTETGAVTAKLWGTFHNQCFERAIDSPEIALAEIKKIAKKAATPAKQRKHA
jgi:hypothetical protein